MSLVGKIRECILKYIEIVGTQNPKRVDIFRLFGAPLVAEGPYATT